MATLEQMRTRIADDLARDDLTTQIDKAINRAVEHYEKDRLWFNEKVWTFNTVSAQETIAQATASTSDLLAWDVVTLTRNSTDIYPLEQISFQQLRELNNSGTSSRGCPTLFSLFNKNFYFYPVPDAAYAVTVYGQRGYSTLSASADTNDWLSEAEDLIEARARWWLYKRVIRDADEAAAAKDEEMEALESLRERDLPYKSTGRIKPND